jgi:glycosyltransferase involved in cell wall biosynthesis
MFSDPAMTGMADIRLSVVIAAHNAAAVIETCLSALEPQWRTQAMEVIVADGSDDGTAEIVRTRFPWVRLLHFDQPMTIPVLRGRGIEASCGAVVAILDPYSVAAADWAERVLDAHQRRQNVVIGGSVDLYRASDQSWAAWALYLNEYGLFMPPISEGETWIVPGSNVSYKRTALFDGAKPRYSAFWKTFANWTVEGTGSPLWLAEDVKVALNKPIPLNDFLKTRYDHGRCFGGMRLNGAGRGTRAWRAAVAPVVPLILAGRWMRGFWPKRRHRLRFLITLPVQLALFTVWSCGEACGYLRGSGTSCDRLFY